MQPIFFGSFWISIWKMYPGLNDKLISYECLGRQRSRSFRRTDQHLCLNCVNKVSGLGIQNVDQSAFLEGTLKVLIIYSNRIWTQPQWLVSSRSWTNQRLQTRWSTPSFSKWHRTTWSPFAPHQSSDQSLLPWSQTFQHDLYPSSHLAPTCFDKKPGGPPFSPTFQQRIW